MTNRIIGTINLPDIADKSHILTDAQRQAGLGVIQFGLTTRLTLRGVTIALWDNYVSDNEVKEEADGWLPQDAIKDCKGVEIANS